MHRAEDTYVVFSSSVGGEWRDLASVRVGELRGIFPALAEQLLADGFLSVNGFWAPGLRRSRFLPGLNAANKRKRNLAALNAAFTDLDGHAAPLPAIAAELQAEGALPWASVEISSGRGLWLLWAIRAEEGDGPERVNPLRDTFRVALWERVQLAIYQRIRDRKPEACPDRKARDASRVCRVPGSLNSKSGAVVRWALRGTEDSSGAWRLNSYTLRDLAGFFGVSVCEPVNAPAPAPEAPSPAAPEAASPLPTREGKAVPEAVSAVKRRGHAALWTYRLAEFERLTAHRDGHPEGCRHSAGLVLAALLRRNGWPWDRIPARIEQLLGQECRPPVTLDNGKPTGRTAGQEAEALVRSLRERPAAYRRVKAATLGALLRVTPEEASALDLEQLAPRTGPRPPTRTDRRVTREAILREYHAHGERHGWGLADYRQRIAELTGDCPAPSTVWLSLRRLGLPTRAMRRRERGRRGLQLAFAAEGEPGGSGASPSGPVPVPAIARPPFPKTDS